MSDTVLKKMAKHLSIRFPVATFSKDLDYSSGVISEYLNGKKEMSKNFKEKFEKFYNVAFKDFETKNKTPELRVKPKSKGSGGNLIPLFEDVDSIGGQNLVANMNGITKSTEMVDAGDWFPGVTAAIRHYNDSMVEYPSGCILALREIKELSSIVWGHNYVIETPGMRVTKRMQTADDENYVLGYSTNPETYPDGKLRHEPIKILKTDIKRLFLVLGRIVKEHSSGPVITK